MLASVDSFGPMVWIRPTALSLKLDALMTRGPRAGEQAGGDVLTVLLMLITAGCVDGIGDRSHQVGGTVAELPGQRREGGLPGAAGRDIFRMVFDGVVEQRRRMLRRDR